MLGVSGCTPKLAGATLQAVRALLDGARATERTMAAAVLALREAKDVASSCSYGTGTLTLVPNPRTARAVAARAARAAADEEAESQLVAEAEGNFGATAAETAVGADAAAAAGAGAGAGDNGRLLAVAHAALRDILPHLVRIG